MILLSCSYEIALENMSIRIQIECIRANLWMVVVCYLYTVRPLAINHAGCGHRHHFNERWHSRKVVRLQWFRCMIIKKIVHDFPNSLIPKSVLQLSACIHYALLLSSYIFVGDLEWIHQRLLGIDEHTRVHVQHWLRRCLSDDCFVVVQVNCCRNRLQQCIASDIRTDWLEATWQFNGTKFWTICVACA